MSTVYLRPQTRWLPVRLGACTCPCSVATFVSISVSVSVGIVHIHMSVSGVGAADSPSAWLTLCDDPSDHSAGDVGTPHWPAATGEHTFQVVSPISPVSHPRGSRR